VVVPHSLAGLYAPVAAARIGARGIVNLAALTPAPGSSGRQQAQALPGIYTEPYRTAPMTRHDDGSTSVPPEVGRRLLYHDVDAATAARAQVHCAGSTGSPGPSPAPRRVARPFPAVACEADRVRRPGMQDGAARTGAPLTWIPGGHIPMVSHPARRCAVLAAIAAW
jgi:hypothetical protein